MVDSLRCQDYDNLPPDPDPEPSTPDKPRSAVDGVVTWRSPPDSPSHDEASTASEQKADKEGSEGGKVSGRSKGNGKKQNGSGDKTTNQGDKRSSALVSLAPVDGLIDGGDDDL